MNKEIIYIGLVAILLATCFSNVSATTLKACDESTTIKVTLQYEVPDKYVGENAEVILYRIDKDDDGQGHIIDKYSIPFSENTENEYNCKFSVYARDFLDLEKFFPLEDDSIYKVVVKKGLWHGESEEYSTMGIRSEIKYDDIEITLKFGLKSHTKPVNMILARLLKNNGSLRELLSDLLQR